MKLKFPRHIFEKYSGRTASQSEKQTDKMKLTVAFCNFTNAPKTNRQANSQSHYHLQRDSGAELWS
jgi:hypothetical protein